MSTPPPNPYASSPEPQEPWSGQRPETQQPQQSPGQGVPPGQGIPPRSDPYQQPGYGPPAGSPYEQPSADPWAQGAQQQGVPAAPGGAGTPGAPPFGPGGPDGPGMQQGAPAGAPYQQPKPAPGTDLGGDLGASFTWMWQAFSRNLGAFLVPGIVWFVGGVVLAVIVAVGGSFGVAAAVGSPTDDSSEALFIALTVLTVVLAVLVILIPTVLWQTGAAKAAGIVHTGTRPTIGQAFAGSGRIIGTAVLYLLATGVGTLLFYIPGLIVAVLFFLALPASVQGASPIEAFKQSFALVKANVATAIVAYVIIMAASGVLGSLVITVFAMIPLMVLFQFALYQRLSGRELTEPVRA